MFKRGTCASMATAWLVALLLFSACGSPESIPGEDEASPPPALENTGAPAALPPAPPDRWESPAPPIPPLVDAPRPKASPLVAILDEPLPLVLDAPEFEFEADLGGVPSAALEAPAVAASASLPELSLAELGDRLRESDALGVFTKVALKNQIDDLLGELSRFHRQGRGRLEKLQDRYDSLVLKILALVQDAEPQLATDIARSCETLWGLLADPQGFARLEQGEI
jgi:hypothetical protein